MILIVGLGNPGRKFANTKHNIGFMVADFLAKKLEANFKEKEEFFIAQSKIDNKEVLIVKPKTYMNLSGRAVKVLLDEETQKALPESLIVIHDDLDLPLGKIRIKKNGSSGGHKGIQSIIEQIGTKNFIRLKIGIGKDPSQNSSEYVLSPFTKKEKPLIKEKISLAASAVISIITEGLEKSMNIYNRETL